MTGADRSASTERAGRACGPEPVHEARIKRNAWILGVLAIGFYVGCIAWNLWRSTAGF